MISHAIEAKSLTKIYKGQNKQEDKLALDNINLAIPRGSIFGLLGPNGAGKSTFINILAGLVMKTSGNAKIWDIDIDRHARQSRAAIGIVPQELNLDAFFTPREMLETQAGLYGVPKGQRRTDELLKAVNLFDKSDAYARTLSGGMRRRIMVAKAMVHSPPVLVLDEPTAGVDIELRQSLWGYIRELNKAGTTIVLTTHYLEEAEELCDHIAIINHGKVVACEKKQKLLSRLDSKTLYVTLKKGIKKLPKSIAVFSPQHPKPNELIFSYTPNKNEISKILDSLVSSNLDVQDIKTEESDLEDIFLQLTNNTNT